MENMTAKMSCFVRAFHHNSGCFHVFDDCAAEMILGEDYRVIAENLKQGIPFFLPDYKGNAEDALRLIVDKQLAPSVLGRSAFCERAFENEILLGCEQVILFAAGYDTFSTRHTGMKMFELDLPQVIADKKERLERAGLSSESVYVACDLSSCDWRETIVQAGFDSTKKACASLLGISYYLDKTEFVRLLKNLRSVIATGSMICFDYPSADESRETKTNQKLAAGAGEPMKAVWTINELECVLQNAGFQICEQLNETDITEKYFAEYNRNNPEHTMTAPKGVGYLKAMAYPSAAFYDEAGMSLT